MSPSWHRLRVAAELPGQAGGIARVMLLPRPPSDVADLAAGAETCCLLWPGATTLQARCLQWGRPIHLCGHGLLAAAHHWLGQRGDARVTLDGGDYRVTASRDASRTWLTLARPTCEAEPLSPFTRALCPGAPATDAAIAGGAAGYRILAWPAGTDLRRLRPDTAAIRDHDGRALIVTAAAGPGSVALRYFAPQYGNDEDAATGSACAVLADYWQRRSGAGQWRMLQLSRAGALFHARIGREGVSIGARVVDAAAGPVRGAGVGVPEFPAGPPG